MKAGGRNRLIIENKKRNPMVAGKLGFCRHQRNRLGGIDASM